MNKTSFVLDIKLLTSNFDLALDPKTKEDKARMRLIFDILENKGFSDQDFKNSVIGIISNETNLFGKLPTIAMFMKYAKKDPMTPKERANIEVERILEAAIYPVTTLFDNGFTNATALAYGGLTKINYDMHDSFNPSPKKREWVKKELIEIWLACQADNRIKEAPLIIDSNITDIKLIGDKNKCQQMLNKQKQLQAPVNKRYEEVVKSIGNQDKKVYKKFDFENARKLLAAACEGSPYYEEK